MSRKFWEAGSRVSPPHWSTVSVPSVRQTAPIIVLGAQTTILRQFSFTRGGIFRQIGCATVSFTFSTFSFALSLTSAHTELIHLNARTFFVVVQYSGKQKPNLRCHLRCSTHCYFIINACRYLFIDFSYAQIPPYRCRGRYCRRERRRRLIETSGVARRSRHIGSLR